jgi:two-component system, NtrC family, sensor histidine kinase HydH
MWKTVVTPTILVSASWIAVSSASTYYMNSLSQWHASLLRHNVTSIRAATVMNESLWKMHGAYRETFHDRDISHLQQMREYELQFKQALSSISTESMSPDESRIVGSIRERFAAYRNVVMPRAEGRITRNGVGPGSPVRSTTLARQVADTCRELLEMNEKLMTESFIQRARLEATWSAVGILFGLWISRRLRRSISHLSVTLHDASGQLEQEIEMGEVRAEKGSDELAQLNQQVETISTRVRQAVVELQQARNQVSHSERLVLVGELAAGLAHELRNPLSAVKLLIQSAARRGTGQSLDARQFQIVLREISRMEATIQGMLDFARPPKLNRVNHDLRDTIRRAVCLVEARANSEQVRLETALPLESLPVDGDAEQLHQVFVNLLLNGIESMPQGGEIRVEGAVVRGASDKCRVSFSDTGRGIPEDCLPRIFEPFMTTKERGTGLGLAICRRIVKKHGGLISAANLPQGGAVFAVELPLAGMPALVGENPPSMDSETEIVVNPAALISEVEHAEVACD